MITLRAGCTTAEYVWSCGIAEATVIEEKDDDDQPLEDENNIDECDEISADVDAPPSDELPLLFFFDSESTGGSMYNNHIIKVGSCSAWFN